MAKELTFAEKKNLIDKMTASINNKYGQRDKKIRSCSHLI